MNIGVSEGDPKTERPVMLLRMPQSSGSSPC